MKTLLYKEVRLASSLITWIFLAFALMTFIPGYPILVGAFFLCLGIFHSFQNWRENNDILYTALLPVRKTDVVNAKFIFVVLIQVLFFVLSFIMTIVRLTALKNSAVYVSNAMMNANQAYLAWILLVFALFNIVFVSGFFKTAYKFAKPFVTAGILIFILVAVAEALHHIPGLEFLNKTDAISDARLWVMFIAAAVIYALVTLLAVRISKARFEKIDL